MQLKISMLHSTNVDRIWPFNRMTPSVLDCYLTYMIWRYTLDWVGRSYGLEIVMTLCKDNEVYNVLHEFLRMESRQEINGYSHRHVLWHVMRIEWNSISYQTLIEELWNEKVYTIIPSRNDRVFKYSYHSNEEKLKILYVLVV